VRYYPSFSFLLKLAHTLLLQNSLIWRWDQKLTELKATAAPAAHARAAANKSSPHINTISLGFFTTPGGFGAQAELAWG